MTATSTARVCAGLAACAIGLSQILFANHVGATSISLGRIGAPLVVFHADSLSGPMKELKMAFEAKHADVTIYLTPSTSRQLADRVLKGEACDVFAPSSSAIANELVAKNAAAWSVVFSANEMVIITPKGNPKGIQKVADLAKPGVIFARITGEKDLGTGRTIEFLKRATKLEGSPELADKIIDAADKQNSVPDTVRAVRERKADAGVVYYSAAVAAQNYVEIIRFPASVNMSEAIQNAATVPSTAKNPKEAIEFVNFILSSEGQTILLKTGQPPVVPAIRNGKLPPELAN
jgi:molybdate transport system substrate-binding protein